MPVFATRSFKDIVTDVACAQQWLDTIAVQHRGTRLEGIKDGAGQLVADLDNLPPEEVVARHSSAETFYVLSDGFAFGRIARQLGNLPSHLVPRGTLRDALAGPLVPADETTEDGSNDARNKFAELELAADLMQKGIRVTGFDDVRFQFNDSQYHTQCKRPFSLRGFDSNVEKAYVQLGKRMKYDSDRGLIAVAVDKALQLDRGYVVRASVSGTEIEREIRRLHPRLLAASRRPWERFVDTRVIGIVFIYKLLAWTQKLNVLGTAYYLALQPLALEETLQASEVGQLLSLVNELKEHA